MDIQIKALTEEPSNAGRVRQKNQSIILQAAEQEFLEHGYKGASLKRVAERADIPRANVHYYYKNKDALYAAVLSHILTLWDTATITDEDDPKEVLTNYIRAKVKFSQSNPEASRIFASEIIHGAPRLLEYLETDFREWTDRVTGVFRQWIADKKLDPVDPHHLMFLIWGSTQHYADFGIQICAALNKSDLTDEDYDVAANTLVHIIIKGCGIK